MFLVSSRMLHPDNCLLSPIHVHIQILIRSRTIDGFLDSGKNDHSESLTSKQSFLRWPVL